MPGLVPGIHVFLVIKTWMAGTSGEQRDAVFDGWVRPRRIDAFHDYSAA
jgi:hypothetical protein